MGSLRPSPPRIQWALLALVFAGALQAQPTGSIQGIVRLKETGETLRNAEVLLVETGRTTVTNRDGGYDFKNLDPGAYHVIAHLGSGVTEEARRVEVAAGGIAEADFYLEVTALKHEITVSAAGRSQTAFESFQSVDSLDAFDLTEDFRGSIGESLDHRVGTGVAKRSFGPGASRPIIRGFDGDRVLIMQDGIRTGTLSSQSGDHGELLNVAGMDRVEVVKGPATLLYGGNAMGGTVNSVSRHHDFSQHAHRHEGLRGFVSSSAGTTNALVGGSAGFEYGKDKWMVWGSGNGFRAGDYNVPGGESIANSRYNANGGRGGFGYYGDKAFFSFEGGYQSGRNGIPFGEDFHGGHEEEGEEHHEEGEDHDEEGEDHDEEHGEEDDHDEHEEEIERISVDARRWSVQGSFGLRDLGQFAESFLLKLNYTDWNHDEIEFFEGGETEIGTAFRNDQFIYRGQFEQRRIGALSGRFGFWGMARDYEVTGEESLAPPVDQNAFALFALEELDFERVRFQFGGRVDFSDYNPAFAERGGGHGHEEEEDHDEEGEEHEDEHGDEHGEIPDARERNFTGASASAGVRVNLWEGGAALANYYHSYRPPALEELYNFGPHVGNLAFEIGNPDLDAERGNGVDLSLRHDFGRVRTTLNYFFYDFSNFIFPFADGEFEDELQVIEYTQLDSRFTGAEAKVDVALHPTLWLNLAGDYVNAKSTDTNTFLPRIPPLRGKIGLDYHWRNLSVRPELIVANQQHLTFTNETRTPGYAVWNLKATYSIPRATLAHQLSAEVFNIGDRLYRNHSSFIKDLAPEIGRGVRFSYTVRFF